MKKRIVLLLAFALCLALCACGGKEAVAEEPTEETLPEVVLLSKDEMLATAVELDDYEEAFESNQLRAEEKYVGNHYLVTGTISEIESDHIEINSFSSSGSGVISVEMPREDLMNVTTGQRVQIVGRFESFTTEENDLGYGYTEKVYNGVMSNGYLVQDKFEISGIFRMYYIKFRDMDGNVHMQYGMPDKWNIGLDVKDDNVIEVTHSMVEEIPVNHVEGVDIRAVTFDGQELRNEQPVTFYAKIIGNTLSEVELVSAGE